MKSSKGKLDRLADATARGHAHRDSTTIYSRMRVLQVEIDEEASSITNLMAELANARERKASKEAALRGLSSVVERR